MLIRKDKEFTHDASIIQSLVSKGFVTGELKTGFPAEQIARDDNFISLLYYFGMVTIGGFYRGKPRFVIPNEVVCEQVYTYLLDNYHDNQLETDTYRLGQLEENMAYDGDFRPFFLRLAARPPEGRGLRAWLHAGPHQPVQLLPPHLRAGQPGRLCRHLPPSAPGGFHRHGAFLHHRAEVPQEPCHGHGGGSGRAGGPGPGASLCRYGECGREHRPHHAPQGHCGVSRSGHGDVRGGVRHRAHSRIMFQKVENMKLFRLCPMVYPPKQQTPWRRDSFMSFLLPGFKAAMDRLIKYLVSAVRIAVLERRFGFHAIKSSITNIFFSVWTITLGG